MSRPTPSASASASASSSSPFGSSLIPIACRFVSTDQWLVTHLDPSLSISHVKQALLSRFLPDPEHVPLSPRPKTRRTRALSPITFSSHGHSSAGIDDDDDLEDEDVSFDDRYKYPARPSAPKPPAPPPCPTHYTLISFSTTQLLEDHFSLAWYGIRPHELLELHPPAPALLSLPRSLLDEYVSPYFEARVWALRVVGSELDVARGRTDDSAVKKSAQKKKLALEWRERWAVIHRGIFMLCRERNDSTSLHASPLSALRALRDGTHVPARAQSSQHIICAQFQTHQARGSGSEAGGGWWRRGSRDTLVKTGTGEAWDAFARRGSKTGIEDADDAQDDTIWVVLDMGDSAAYAHLLRILHRHAPRSCVSSFAALRSPISPMAHPLPDVGYTFPPPPDSSPSSLPLLPAFELVSPAPSPHVPRSLPYSSPLEGRTPTQHHDTPRPSRALAIETRFEAEEGLPYPEWRLALTRKARKAGLGAVGRAMELVMFGEEDEGPGSDEEAHERRSSSSSRHGDVGRNEDQSAADNDNLSDESSGSGDSDVSEAEWVGWMADLPRQRRVQARARERQLVHSLSTGDTAAQWGASWGTEWGGASTAEDSGESSPASAGWKGKRREVSGRSAHSRTLSSYSSADSLLRRTVRGPPTDDVPPRAASASPPPHRMQGRPLSPLSAQLDDEFDGDSSEGDVHLHRALYGREELARQRSFEPGLRIQGAMPIPMSMSMTAVMRTTTSTVSVGYKAEPERARSPLFEGAASLWSPGRNKGKKAKEKEKEKERDTGAERRRRERATEGSSGRQALLRPVTLKVPRGLGRSTSKIDAEAEPALSASSSLESIRGNVASLM
ncbi:hypothetical protein A0H81_14036 [Grifola frondosa]|uniref:Uncharacterized protein n=1 Tax=Grifola frondosa TaxID=5627 RepID=A0A1C7LPV8_GRIFR|nr:hypothetical protein A0H81_14036 [Grifola frondosa]